MAKSGFMPAWMKISNSDLTKSKTNKSISPTECLTDEYSRRERSTKNFSRIHNPNSQGRLHSISSFEQDFPSLNGHDKSNSSSSSSIWTNAARKFRLNPTEPLKLTNHHSMRKYPLNHSKTLELSTNFKTQTKNLDKRSEFFNSLKTHSKIEEHQNGMTSKFNGNLPTNRRTLLLLSVPETSEEKEFLIRMGWKDGNEITYEITDQDKEEYEKRLRHFRKTNQTYAALMSALHRRTLPCINIQDLLRIERLDSISDDDDDESSNG